MSGSQRGTFYVPPQRSRALADRAGVSSGASCLLLVGYG